jgi:hypothetical protein
LITDNFIRPQPNSTGEVAAAVKLAKQALDNNANTRVFLITGGSTPEDMPKPFTKAPKWDSKAIWAKLQKS